MEHLSQFGFYRRLVAIHAEFWFTISDYSKNGGSSHQNDLVPLLIFYFFIKKKWLSNTVNWM